MPSENRISLDPEVLRAANISPVTFLATDFLNHYNEVAMLIDLLSIDDEVVEDVLDWKPASYIEHFSQSGFRDKELAIEAYGAADAMLISDFEATCETLDIKIQTIQDLLRQGRIEQVTPLGKDIYNDIATINTLIVGAGDASDSTDVSFSDPGCSQSDIDDLFA